VAKSFIFKTYFHKIMPVFQIGMYWTWPEETRTQITKWPFFSILDVLFR